MRLSKNKEPSYHTPVVIFDVSIYQIVSKKYSSKFLNCGCTINVFFAKKRCKP